MPAPTGLFRFVLLVLAAVFLFTSTTRLYTVLQQRDDIWWTPRAMTIPLEAAQHRVRVYVRGSELEDLVAKRQLLLQDHQGTRVVTRTDVGLRFNNWDRVRAQRIPDMLVSAITAGAAGALLMVGLILTLAGRRSG
jgi:hypothetical protein